MREITYFLGVFLFFSLLIQKNESVAPCNPLEQPDVCGFYPSTYANLSLMGVPPFCNANCTLEGGWDLCGICGGLAAVPNQTVLFPAGLSPNTRLGGMVAIWNGTVAISQHIAQEYAALVNAPVVTFQRADDGSYSTFLIPWSTDGTNVDLLPLGLGYGLAMSANYLAIGSHSTNPRIVQLWVRSPDPAWEWLWTGFDPCPGNYFGFAMAIDERLPAGSSPGIYGTVIAGDPAAYLSGRVYVYFTYSPDILQTLFYGFGNETERSCFGESVSADSGYLAIGAPSYTYASQSKSGSVFLFQWNPSLGLQGEYEFLLQIPPPTPVVNGGFGESVSVWNNIVMIGDNQRTVYLYSISGMSVTPYLLQQPTGINLVSRLGYTVSIWDQFMAAGDEDFIPWPTNRGETFVWGRNPLVSTFYRLMYDFNDVGLISAPTHYGASVSIRGGCYLASGAPQDGPFGGAYVIDLCQDDCYGCDGILNSCLFDDLCGVCNGDNSTCLDCFGVINGTAVLDACSVCNGTNTTCVLPSPASITLSCNTSSSVNLTHAFQSAFGSASWTIIAPFPTKGTATISGNLLTYKAAPFQFGSDTVRVNGTLFGGTAWGDLNVTITIGNCLDCFGVLNGPSRIDACNVCGGDNSTCSGCDGVPYSNISLDYCGVCGGNNSTCLDLIVLPTQSITCTAQVIFLVTHEPAATPVTWAVIDGPVIGSVFINTANGFIEWLNPGIVGVDWFVVQATSLLNSSIVSTINVTFVINDCSDCDGAYGGTQLVDLCGVCGGDGTTCADCLGIPNGAAVLDPCGVCNGDGTTCADCFGVPNGGAVLGICGCDDNVSCIDTTGKWWIYLFFVITFALICASIYVFLKWVIDWRRYPLISPDVPKPVHTQQIVYMDTNTYLQEGEQARSVAFDPSQKATQFSTSKIPIYTSL